MPYDMNTFATVTANHNDGHGDRSSEEAIIHKGADDAAPQHADDVGRGDKYQIHTTTTVKVESHQLEDGDEESDFSR